MRTTLTRTATLLAFAVSAALPAMAAPGSGPTSTVIYVAGNDLVLKASDGKILNYTVPSGYKFTAGGKQVGIGELKAGSTLSAPVSTGADPQIVSGISVTKAKVYAVTPPDTVTLIMSDGSKDFTLPTGESFLVDGKPTPLASLKPDTMVDVTVVTPAADGAEPGPAPATPALAGTLLVAKAEDLPSAGTNLPLYGLIGFAMILTGFAMLRLRRQPVPVRARR